MKKWLFPVFMLFLLLFFWDPAYAYIDAGTGSIILQLLLGGVAGILVVVKLYWHRIKELLGIKTK